jgi:thiamine-monophosphate kinase
VTEDDLIAGIRAICDQSPARAPAPRKILVAIGDDAAVWQPSRSHRSVITTDALVDGVHFQSATVPARAVGHRAMAANLSDVAAMGARPILATVALGVTDTATEGWILDAYRGMAGLAAQHGGRIVGGDITRAPALTIVISVVGEVSPRHLKLRGGGRAGDVVAVTGPLGASRAGLELLRREVAVDDELRAAAAAAFATPQPRVREGRWLAASASVHALMDCSDGLSTDLRHLAEASGCGAVVERVPVHGVASAVARSAGADPVDWALSGGEDFELLVAIAPRAFSHLDCRFAQRFGRPLERIGRLEANPGIHLETQGVATVELAASGWDHLRSFRTEADA